ncbi:putative UDP-glucuronosyl/UDP-glucosyltransferase [Medicago truncatula]|uniref:Putative UDP-glucuronosyl/UDP-glucosyltransferase n=1 Tax=Medicago truncatula TaxID=3880 RepID=G7KED3_MEDTR|nr:UDP-glycosyltransferase 87A1 [Medicago truncatula]AES98784.1 UDP-glucosyltransferase family protein [Medicago truncatula]RHN56614.1 putative UDP-glucuronosyl/UDP-glucosyltransferase [Medicago truncatula]
MNISDSGNAVCHVVAMPFPGRGHINPMLSFCKILTSQKPNNLLITFVLTEEWLTFIGADPKPESIRFATIPNVIPPEREKAGDFPGFYEAVMTKMEAPFEKLLDQLELPVDVIVGDVELRWPVNVGNRRNVPVAAFWTMSASFYSMLHHLDVFSRKHHLTVDKLDEQAENIPGISSFHIEDVQTVLCKNDHQVLQLALGCISKVPKANYLLLTTVQELEAETIDSLKSIFPFPIYPIGPSIPYLDIEEKNPANTDHSQDYIKWLDSQPSESVLYISLGSFLSVSNAQMDEIVEALNNSGIRYLYVARGETSRLKDKCGDKGMVIPWCDQLKVLSHSSIGGFWSHCGWNSTLETVFAGVPILTFPLFLDQVPNSTQIVDEWKNGWKVEIQSKLESDVILAKEDIEELVKRFMDLENQEGKKIRDRARELKVMFRKAIGKGGSSDRNLDAFISDISS